LSYLANTQTDKLWQKHNLLGGGNNLLLGELSVFCRCIYRRCRPI